MANWTKKDYYQASESDNEEDVAIEKLQQRNENLQENDFLPEFQQESLDYNQFTEDEVLEIIQRDSPELLGVLETMNKVVKVWKKSKKNNEEFCIKYCKILALHISFYLLIKSKGKVVVNHPVVNSIKSLEKTIASWGNQIEDTVEEAHGDRQSQENPEQSNLDYQNKRYVDEKIKKNKGIVKKRKKIERNVRVKNKMKYLRKVKVRRATLGISELRNKQRYEGEVTGIRKNLIKSIKLT